MAIMFWKIIKNCEPENIFFDLLTQGEHKSRLSHYYFKQSSSSEVRKHAFVNRLNDSIPLLGDTFLDLSEYAMKKFVKKIVIENIPAKVPAN
jgi:predicted secreted acid phosphatase